MEKPPREAREQPHLRAPKVTQGQLASIYLATTTSLALAIDARYQFKDEHVLRVQRYAVATAQEMGVTGADLEAVRTGALLHDVGIVSLPDQLLLKPSLLTEEEFATLREHAENGALILEPVSFPWPVVSVVRHHHERWDGTGYPDGLVGEGIPLAARIVAIADSYDAITSSRPYRRVRSHGEAQTIVRSEAGTHFDPRVVDAFLRVVGGLAAETAPEPDASASSDPAVSAAHRKAA